MPVWRRWSAWCILAGSYGVTLVIARMLRARRCSAPSTGRLLVTGTFYNRGWFLSHMEPLAACGMREVMVITDVPQPAPAGVKLVTPPAPLVRVIGRAAAKLCVMWQAGREHRPDVCMGYHLFPGALSALIVARMVGRPAVYQMTGGPIELLGGGYSNENELMRQLGKPSPFLERLALAAVREFDLVVVRGGQAKRFLSEQGVKRISVITGSIRAPNGQSCDRSIDLVFVGRLAPIKQPEQFVEVVAQVARQMPGVTAAMVGDGPQRQAVLERARQLGVSQQIRLLGRLEDAYGVLRESRVFLLTSRSEAMPIALLEAMGCGVPGVCARVGEVGDVIEHGLNGYLADPGDVDSLASYATELLRSESNWKACSAAARQTAQERVTTPAIAARWRGCLRSLVASEERVASVAQVECP